MITHPAYATEPWCLRETGLDLDVLAQSESLFALSNGHIGWRGNLDEGEPHGLPGTYLNGVFEARPLPYAEAGYGYPEAGQTVIDVTNGKVIRLLVDDQPFDVRYGQLVAHERVLDFRTGMLHREVEWVSPGGQGVRVRSARLVSLVQRSVAAICYEVEATDTAVRVVLQSELVTNESLPPSGGDPRGPPRCTRRSCQRPTTAPGRGPSWCTAPRSAVCASVRRWTITSRPRSRCRSRARASPTWAGSPSRRRSSPGSVCGWSSSSPTAGRRSVRNQRSSTRSMPP